ncbi:MAG: DUF1294 domain-containing protein [Planctomycetes bacterium]|nr:DUF1294 domain-containing protein [Planctomycetota bacterium]
MRNAFRRNPFRAALIVAGGLAVLIAALFRFGLGAGWPLSLALAINVITFALYAYDKSVAGSGATRVPEAALHLVAALGGSPAALAAQWTLRHKTSKRSFQWRFWAIVVAQAVLVTWFIARGQP